MGDTGKPGGSSRERDCVRVEEGVGAGRSGTRIEEGEISLVKGVSAHREESSIPTQ